MVIMEESEIQDLEITEFAALEDAKSYYDGLDLSEKSFLINLFVRPCPP